MLTFPHFGDLHLYGRLFFRELGVEIVTPPPNSRRELSKGALLAPEEMCLPFKLMLANLLSAREQGADTVVMAATMGPCRLGEYGELLKAILDREGAPLRWILLDPPRAIGLREVLRRLGETVEDRQCSWIRLFWALGGVYGLVRSWEGLQAAAARHCCCEQTPGSTGRLLKACRRELEEAASLRQARRTVRRWRKGLPRTGPASPRPLRILLTGEIYSLTEPFANHHIESFLLDRGVCYEKPVTLGWWLRRTLLTPLGGLRAEKRKNPALPHCIGGYAKETVMDALKSRKRGFDGVIQILPTGCMPEIVSKAVFDRLSGEGELKVLTLIFDEMDGEAGYLTRIEAFLDMLEMQKKKNGQALLSYKEGNR
ncbi:MAG: hypothetical protein Q4C22_04985 [Bacillota bacterium]|nr:hypothetical protein [Bacillota bacterium]